jgi:hypothetical protein
MMAASLLLLRSIAKAASYAWETKPEFFVLEVVWRMNEFRDWDKDNLECMVQEMKETLVVDTKVRRF